MVNFNADASCLSTAAWLGIVAGGPESTLVRWLSLYVKLGKKVVLGFPGATIADMATLNPEAIVLINEHPEVFEVILRPFAHDIALLRTNAGFDLNFDSGRKIVTREFRNVCNCFLPPEFMLTNGQLARLQGLGVAGVFINAARFAPEIRSRIPTRPYFVRGLLGSSVRCLPFLGELTELYLEALHSFDVSGWNRALAEADGMPFFWRDGESSFLLPDGLAREKFWLENEEPTSSRQHLGNLEYDFVASDRIEGEQFRSYAVHSFTAWMKEFRMLGFVHRLRRIEEQLEQFEGPETWAWLLTINSDILSAVEKASPVVPLRERPGAERFFDYTIRRSERGFEGEEYLAILEMMVDGQEAPAFVASSPEPHMVRWRGRMEYLSRC